MNSVRNSKSVFCIIRKQLTKIMIRNEQNRPNWGKKKSKPAGFSVVYSCEADSYSVQKGTSRRIKSLDETNSSPKPEDTTREIAYMHRFAKWKSPNFENHPGCIDLAILRKRSSSSSSSSSETQRNRMTPNLEGKLCKENNDAASIYSSRLCRRGFTKRSDSIHVWIKFGAKFCQGG